MSKFKLEITLGNDAMQTPDDVAGALGELAERLAFGDYGTPEERYDVLSVTPSGAIWDTNGNRVGKWEVTE